ncbi:MAG: hypothetical protein EU552_02845 [Promethearchaeota archaeon]|nr:MAG: hypothetical protein EU552_02845 [Candidatus Lokiarchaeota archaeon]
MANGKGLIITALLFGLIGAGLGGYAFFQTTLAPLFGLSEQPSDTETWYDEVYQISILQDSTPVPLTGLSVVITTSEVVSLHVLYTGYARINTVLGDDVYMAIYINDVRETDEYYVNAFGVATTERYDIDLQYYNSSLPVGTYNITVWAEVDDTSTVFFMNSLFVQTNT